MRKLSLACSLLLLPTVLFAQSTNPPGLDLIKTAELKTDLYALAGAKYRGRSAGTLDELKAAMWLGEKYREIGLQPGGDDGTYFQYFTLWRNHVTDNSSISINNTPLKLWEEAAISQMAHVSLDAPIVYLGNALAVDFDAVDVEGKVVALEANPAGINSNIFLPTWRYSRSVYVKYGLPLLRKGAKAIIFIADETAEKAWDDATENYKRGSYDIEGGSNENVTATVPIIWLRASAKKELEKGTARMKADIQTAKYPYPSVNIIGTIDGTDPKLKSEYLLYSGHTDAHGVRNEIKNDSIYYGADDNGSVNVAMLANARAFVKNPVRRSVVFIIHGAEERGLLGSRYYTAHPTIPLDNIVTVLNGDMIGRNHPDSAAVLGVIPPHRTSQELVDMVLAANNEGPKFKLDTEWDKASHPEGWFFRSDHLPYARLGIPSLMYTTLLHPDYHTPQDNAGNIDYPKLKKMADWMYRTGWKVANADKRPAREPNFKLER
ncbi:M28 family metallopeptidase [Persicitalea sp.]|uniref:M28 family metallopeptidase n=1 Tax=Persicitalea sp. TaxID=3100273 RepID=UPI00359345E1